MTAADELHIIDPAEDEKKKKYILKVADFEEARLDKHTDKSFLFVDLY
jgi:hypothetical protein